MVKGFSNDLSRKKEADEARGQSEGGGCMVACLHIVEAKTRGRPKMARGEYEDEISPADLLDTVCVPNISSTLDVIFQVFSSLWPWRVGMSPVDVAQGEVAISRHTNGHIS
jgi:hypothetical protein